MLTAHLPNDWCLHGTSPEECLSHHRFLHLNNTVPIQTSSLIMLCAGMTGRTQFEHEWQLHFSFFIFYFFFPNLLSPPLKSFYHRSSHLPNSVLLLCCPINHPSLINRPTVPRLSSTPTLHLAQPCCPAGMQCMVTHAYSQSLSAAGN